MNIIQVLEKYLTFDKIDENGFYLFSYANEEFGYYNPSNKTFVITNPTGYGETFEDSNKLNYEISPDVKKFENSLNKANIKLIFKNKNKMKQTKQEIVKETIEKLAKKGLIDKKKASDFIKSALKEANDFGISNASKSSNRDNLKIEQWAIENDLNPRKVKAEWNAVKEDYMNNIDDYFAEIESRGDYDFLK